MNNKIVFTLNNTGIHQTYASLCFAIFNGMLAYDRVSILHYIEQTGYYYPADFRALFNQVTDEDKKQVPMNTTETILFFSVIHFVCSILLDENEEEFLKECLDEDDSSFIETRNKLMGFGTVATKLLITKFLKGNKEFLKAVDKIRGIEIIS